MATTDSKTESGQDGQGLDSILSTDERVELTLLLANITEVMRKQITDTFDASHTNAKQPQQALNLTEKNPNVTDAPKSEAEAAEEEMARKSREQREKELSAPKMLELKKDSLKFFDDWRESVISRVGTAVNNPKDVVKQQKENATVATTPEDAAITESKVISTSESIIPLVSFSRALTKSMQSRTPTPKRLMQHWWTSILQHQQACIHCQETSEYFSSTHCYCLFYPSNTMSRHLEFSSFILHPRYIYHFIF